MKRRLVLLLALTTVAVGISWTLDSSAVFARCRLLFRHRACCRCCVPTKNPAAASAGEQGSGGNVTNGSAWTPQDKFEAELGTPPKTASEIAMLPLLAP